MPVARLEEAAHAALAVLERLDSVDADRMTSVIKSKLLETTSAFEDSPATHIQDNTVRRRIARQHVFLISCFQKTVAFLYFDAEKDLESLVFGDRVRLQQLLERRCGADCSSFWLELQQKWCVGAPHVTLLARKRFSLFSFDFFKVASSVADCRRGA